MQSGRILQDGSPVQLEHSDGPYRDLLMRQSNPMTMLMAAE